MALAVLAVGRLVGDVTTLSAWLAWVPPILSLALAVLTLCIAFALRTQARPLLRIAAIVFVLLFGFWVLTGNMALWRAQPERTDDLVLVHWNASWPGDSVDLSTAIAVFEGCDADILVVTEAGRFGWTEEGRAFTSAWPSVVRVGGVLILARGRVLQARPVLATNGVQLHLLQFMHNGIARTAWIVDLPSDPARSRQDIFAALLAGARERNVAQPEIVLGDFNVDSDSASLAAAFSEFHNAFGQGGVGWGGTWPRRFPLWQLDQVLLSDTIDCVSSAIIDPGISRHRVQRVVLRAAASPAGDRPASTPATPR